MKKILIPKSAIAEFLTLVKADADKLEKLISFFNSNQATSPRTHKFLSKISDLFSISIEEAYDIVILVDFLSQQKRITKATDDEFILETKTFVRNNGDEEALKKLDDQPVQQAIINLFGSKPIAELAKKKEKLKTGLLKTVTNIEGTCELRPVFNQERTHIVDKVITVIARLTLEDDKDKEEDVIFQLNDRSLKKLKEFLEITDKKKKIMKKEITATDAEK